MNMGVHYCTVTRKSNINQSVLVLFNIELNILMSDMLSLKCIVPYWRTITPVLRILINWPCLLIKGAVSVSKLQKSKQRATAFISIPCCYSFQIVLLTSYLNTAVGTFLFSGKMKDPSIHPFSVVAYRSVLCGGWSQFQLF